MNTLESVIRPFQTPDSINDKQTPVTTVLKEPVPNAIIIWGAPGQKPTVNSNGINFKVLNINNLFDELSRTYQSNPINIVDQNNPNNVITTLPVSSITMQVTPVDPADSLSGVAGGMATATTPITPAAGSTQTLSSSGTVTTDSTGQVTNNGTASNTVTATPGSVVVPATSTSVLNFAPQSST